MVYAPVQTPPSTDYRLRPVRRNWLKHLVVATSFPPFRQGYTLLYRAIAWWVARYLAKDPHVGAIYLRGGGTRGELTPGVSDIDFMVVLHPDTQLPSYPLLRLGIFIPFGKRYKKLLTWLPMLDKGIGFVPALFLAEQALTSHQRRYAFLELQHSGQLLHGQDYIAQCMPEIPVPIKQDATLACIEARWHWFFGNFVHQAGKPIDDISLNSMCYRYICDGLRFMEGFHSGTMNAKRAGVLNRHWSTFNKKDQDFAHQLNKLAQKGFRGKPNTVVESSLGFLLRQFDAFYGQLAQDPFAQPLAALEHHLDFRCEEDFAPSPATGLAQEILTHVQTHWPPHLYGAYLVKSTLFPIDDRQLLLQVAPEHLPSIQQLYELNALYEHLQKGITTTVRLFLLLPNAAYCLSTKGLFNAHLPCILSQALSPDLFALLNIPQCQLLPGNYPVWSKPAFTAQAGWFYWMQRLRYRQLLELWDFKAPKPFRMVQQWWKWIQLEVMYRGIASGRLHYPLTLPAIGRVLAAVELEQPDFFADMAQLYRRGVAGEPLENSSVLPQALSFTKQLDPQGHKFTGPPPWLGGSLIR